MIIDQQTDTTGKVLSYARLREIMSKAFSFEWSRGSNKQNKDPQSLLTPACFWALTNSQYEPFPKYLISNNEGVILESKKIFEKFTLERPGEEHKEIEFMTTGKQSSLQNTVDYLLFE
jgi:hypothetical protein